MSKKTSEPKPEELNDEDLATVKGGGGTVGSQVQTNPKVIGNDLADQRGTLTQINTHQSGRT